MGEAAAPRHNRFLLAQWADLLDDDSFRHYWFMRLASHGATNALTYAMLVLVVRHSDSAIATGIFLLTMIGPAAMLGAIAGVAVDRLPRGLMLFACNLLRAVLVFALIGAKEELGGIYMVALGFGIVNQFAAPAESAVLPYIIRDRSYIAANSFINLGTLLSQVAGALILAPVLLKTTNGDPLLFVLMILYAVSAVMVTIIPQFHFASTEDTREMSMRAVRREFATSWLHLCRDATAFLALILLVVTTISTLIVATMMPKFSIQVLHLEPENIVFVLAPVGIAIFLGLRSVEYLSDRFNKLVTISAGYGLMAASLIALGFVPAVANWLQSIDPTGVFGADALGIKGARIAVTIAFGNVYGFALTVVLTMGRALLNERVPVAMQGRVFAAQSILSNLVAIVPVVLASLAADAIGVAPVLICAGVGALLAAAWSRARSSRTVPLSEEPTPRFSRVG
jgi:MFS family permease